MRRVFKYGKFDTRSKIITAVAITLLCALVVALVLFSGNAGIAAWWLSLVGAILLLLVISIPTTIHITLGAVDVRCVVEMTHLPFTEIASVRTLDREHTRRKFPVLGSYGFFGYYGIYYDAQSEKMVRLYCRRRTGLVEITDIFEKTYIISCEEPQELVELIEETRGYFHQ